MKVSRFASMRPTLTAIAARTTLILLADELGQTYAGALACAGT
jgi:hypothetical protein